VDVVDIWRGIVGDHPLNVVGSVAVAVAVAILLVELEGSCATSVAATTTLHATVRPMPSNATIVASLDMSPRIVAMNKVEMSRSRRAIGVVSLDTFQGIVLRQRKSKSKFL
jgi:hypothetical protein